MSDVVVELRPARSVEFDGEMEDLADRLSVSLFMMQAMLDKIEPKDSPQYKRGIRLTERIIFTMDNIQRHMDSIEEEMDRIFSEISDGESVSFSTYDEKTKSLVSSQITTRCHTIRVKQIRHRVVMSSNHHNDDMRAQAPRYG